MTWSVACRRRRRRRRRRLRRRRRRRRRCRRGQVGGWMCGRVVSAAIG